MLSRPSLFDSHLSIINSQPTTEFDLIAAVRRRAGASPRVPVGIGDDAAVLAAPAGGEWLVAADLLLESRHFTIPGATACQIGRKTLAVNLSDIAAMAGRPVAAFVTVAFRRSLGHGFAAELQEGIADLADEFGVTIAGGDTNVWDGPVVAGVTLLGEAIAGRDGTPRAVTRAGAVPGDTVFVTGPLGGSLATGRHLNFTPRVAAAVALHAVADLHAMIDLSDGLLADLGHIAKESGVGITLSADAVPIHTDVPPGEGHARLTAALTDGEDFELAFCVGSADAQALRTVPLAGVRLHEIGMVTAGAGVTVVDAAGRPLTFPTQGWEHRW